MGVIAITRRNIGRSPGENPAVGLILCARTNEAIARYALEGLPTKVLAAEYHVVLADEKLLAEKLTKTPVNLEQFDPLNSRDDLIKLLAETGISFSRPNDVDIAADDGDTSVETRSNAATSLPPPLAPLANSRQVGSTTATCRHRRS
ncbi:PDDEXK nuclease domain-containing protein [Caballeronia telluris]|uniref:YhcG PDDEXK nuclease domain-containing protein n=1 Tax=Caballeronia telluris TaxID=326475 RepID=A0A158KDL9_9BURK|nr:hypothetical protein AWB66_05864 [Caballeronia telluris]